MKHQSLFYCLLISFTGYSQSPVPSYYGPDNTLFTTYNGNFDHGNPGAGQTWNLDLTNFLVTGNTSDHNTVPTAQESADFPGTTHTRTTFAYNGNGLLPEIKTYSRDMGAEVSITGIVDSGLLLNYDLDDATMGHFPLEYGFSNVENANGHCAYGDFNGFFYGSITTTVDAWGILNIVGPPFSNFSHNVTRLKTEQVLYAGYDDVNYVGTISVTTYGYYDNANSTGVPDFRTTDVVIDIPSPWVATGAFSRMELWDNVFLRTKSADLQANTITVFPNPATVTLNIRTGNNEKIKSVVLTDANGRPVLKFTSPENALNIGTLQQGVYFATVTTDSGTTVKSFVKK